MLLLERSRSPSLHACAWLSPHFRANLRALSQPPDFSGSLTLGHPRDISTRFRALNPFGGVSLVFPTGSSLSPLPGSWGFPPSYRIPGRNCCQLHLGNPSRSLKATSFKPDPLSGVNQTTDLILRAANVSTEANRSTER